MRCEHCKNRISRVSERCGGCGALNPREKPAQAQPRARRGIDPADFAQFEQERKENSSVIGKVTLTDDWLYHKPWRKPQLIQLKDITQVYPKTTIIPGVRHGAVQTPSGQAHVTEIVFRNGQRLVIPGKSASEATRLARAVARRLKKAKGEP